MTNTTLISEEYDIPVKVPHGVVQCRYLDVLDFGVQLCTTHNERFGKHSMEIREDIFRRTALDKAFALARTDEDCMGAGLGILEGDWLGLFGIETLPNHRRNGVATAVNHALASWGALRGARRAYLQVEASNDSALKLYSKMEFETEYHYWYRTLGLDTANNSP